MLQKLTKQDRKFVAELAKWYTPSVLAEALVRTSGFFSPNPYMVLPIIQGERDIREEKRLTTTLANLNKRYARCRAPYSRTGHKIDGQRMRVERQLSRATRRAARHRERIKSFHRQTYGTRIMKLATAQRYADKIISELAPMCDRIEVAGSIRRQRPEVGDIDLVILPKHGQLHAIKKRCLASGPMLIANGDHNFHFKMNNGVQVEIYFAEHGTGDLFQQQPCTWGTLLLCRTGSKQFNIWFAKRALNADWHWNPYTGLWHSGHCVAAEEEDMFHRLDLDYIKPEARER